jgi:hypothetical protein
MSQGRFPLPSLSVTVTLQRHQRHPALSPSRCYAARARRGMSATLAAQSQIHVADVFGTPASESGDLGRWEGADS